MDRQLDPCPVINVVSHVLNIAARRGFPNIDLLSLVIKYGTNIDVLHVCIMYPHIKFNSLQHIHNALLQ